MVDGPEVSWRATDPTTTPGQETARTGPEIHGKELETASERTSWQSAYADAGAIQV